MDDIGVLVIEVAGGDELVFDGLQGVEEKVVEEFFAHIVPIVFSGVKIRALRWQLCQHDIIRQAEFS